MIKNRKWMLSLLLATSLGLQAQEKLSIQPTGRVLLDAATFSTDDPTLKSGVALTDIRVGAKLSYGDYRMKAELGYAFGKLSIKDVYLERSFGSQHLVRMGNFPHPFGLQFPTGTSTKIAMEDPVSNTAFYDVRLVGTMYLYQQGPFWGAASVHVESGALVKRSDETDGQGYGMSSRLVYRPWQADGRIFHVGLSGAWQTPKYHEAESLNHSSFPFRVPFPTSVSTAIAQNALVPDAAFMYKFSPEVCAAYGRLGLESQFYYTHINRKADKDAFQAHGAYVHLRGLILGGDYQYAAATSELAVPKPGSLECVLGYNYVDLSGGFNYKNTTGTSVAALADLHRLGVGAHLHGGYLNDASITLSYYFNKYFAWRLRYSYTLATGRPGMDNVGVNLFQTRFQVSF